MDPHTNREELNAMPAKISSERNTLPEHSINSVIVALENFHLAEVSALIALPESEASAIIRKLILENPGIHEEDSAARIAEKLRELLGIDKDESELVKGVLSPAQASQYARICEGVPLEYSRRN